jgi:hypothetical protein
MPARIGLQANAHRTTNPEGAGAGDRYFELTITQSAFEGAGKETPRPADNQFHLYLGVELSARQWDEGGRTTLTI